jgi:hypothetical protein
MIITHLEGKDKLLMPFGVRNKNNRVYTLKQCKGLPKMMPITLTEQDVNVLRIDLDKVIGIAENIYANKTGIYGDVKLIDTPARHEMHRTFNYNELTLICNGTGELSRTGRVKDYHLGNINCILKVNSAWE